MEPTQIESARRADRIATIPNLATVLRLAGVPLFLVLFLGLHADVAAIVVLSVGGSTDWVDGYLARRLGQVSRLGALLDPLADRLYILATLFAFTLRGVVPWAFTAALLARELLLLAIVPILRRYGYGLPEVHYVGKAATMLLLVAFPVLLLAHSSPGSADVASPIGWAFAWWGIVLYWLAGILYVAQAVALVRQARQAGTS